MDKPGSLAVKRRPTPSPGDKSVSFEERVSSEAGATEQLVELMDQFADEWHLKVRESHSTRVYRGGTRSPAVWIEPSQGRLVVDLQSFSRKYPEADWSSIHTAFTRLFQIMNASNQPAARISNLVVHRWDQLRVEVLEPFFRPSRTQ